MRKMALGKTGVGISVMGLGTMYFGSTLNERTSFRLMDLYQEHGGNFLDSATKYASWLPGHKGGDSEMLIGRWLKQKGRAADLVIATKVGFPYEDIPRSLKKEISLMAYSPLLGGIYGKNDVALPIQYQSLLNEQKMSSLRALTSKIPFTANQLVLSWMLHSSPQVIPLVTGSNEKQLIENLEAASISLTSEDMDLLDGPVVETNSTNERSV